MINPPDSAMEFSFVFSGELSLLTVNPRIENITIKNDDNNMINSNREIDL
jgi:hypothetical protein